MSPAAAAAPLILTLNGGSSSIKFALFTAADPPERRLAGQIERIGQERTRLTSKWDEPGSAAAAAAESGQAVAAADHRQAAEVMRRHLSELGVDSAVAGIGHRVVFGGADLVENRRVTAEVLAELRRLTSQDLAHLPREIALIEAFSEFFPGVPEIVCFDTAFHRGLPAVARMLPIPRRYYDAGIRRLGFHGLSYTYLLRRLAAVAGPEAANGRVILAHLGAGASMAAVRGGRPIDTTMAFTPLAGLVMGTRPGDLDPGVLVWLLRSEGLSADQLDELLTYRCGLAGISETSADMQSLLAARAGDPRAAEAVDLFCYQARKFVGALAAALGGLDTLVFSGGIGEHAAEVRAAICDGLGHLGVVLDPAANAAKGAALISAATSAAGGGTGEGGGGRVAVRVIPTNEELILAEAVRAILAEG